MITEKTPKNAKLFSCIICDFICSKQSDFNRHLLTRKHSMIANDNKKRQKALKNSKLYSRVIVVKNINIVQGLVATEHYVKILQNYLMKYQ